MRYDKARLTEIEQQEDENEVLSAILLFAIFMVIGCVWLPV